MFIQIGAQLRNKKKTMQHLNPAQN